VVVRHGTTRGEDAAIIIALVAIAGSIRTVATVWGAPVLQARREARTVLEDIAVRYSPD
jgi:hypothetical protein